MACLLPGHHLSANEASKGEKRPRRDDGERRLFRQGVVEVCYRPVDGSWVAVGKQQRESGSVW
ncbi:MAG: hypothetical protein H0T92_17000 [Pyrinomonadaceae bacterium]|nr:hypothetical protein [Pyrinomonadaceae bacterium]